MKPVRVAIPWEEWKRLSDRVPREAVRMSEDGYSIRFGRLQLTPAEDRTDEVIMQTLKALAALSNDSIKEIEYALGVRRLIER